VGDPANPFLAGSYDIQLRDNFYGQIQVVGEYAYVAEDQGLHIVDVSDPANPFLAGSTVVTDLSSFEAQVSGAYVYILDYSEIHIVDVHDPVHPSLTGSYVAPDDERFSVMHIVGDYMYVVGYSGVHIVNVHDPAHPTQIGFYEQKTSVAETIQMVDDYLYVGDWDLHILDVSDPSNPLLVGRYTEQYISGVDVQVQVKGDYAYVILSNGLILLDIRNPAMPSQVGSYRMVGSASEVFVVNQYAHVLGEEGLFFVDVLDPVNPSLVHAYTTDESNDWGLIYDYAVDYRGGYAYVLNTKQLSILDVRDPAQLSLVGSYAYDYGSILFYELIVQVVDGYAYLMNINSNGSGLIVDVRNPSTPKLVDSDYRFGNINGMQVVGKYAYTVGCYAAFTVGCDAFDILDVSNPAEPHQVGSYSTYYSNLPPQHCYFDVAVVGDYAYVSYGRNPIHDVITSETDLKSGSFVLDIHNPEKPEKVHELDTYAREIVVAGDYAYIASDGDLLILDIHKPAGPKLAGRYETPGYVSDVAVVDNLIYVADNVGGLQILRQVPRSEGGD
jgi:hypothetical protein